MRCAAANDSCRVKFPITSMQDKKITEDNQAGVLSSRYEPGPYSEHERKVISFDQWYLNQLRKSA